MKEFSARSSTLWSLRQSGLLTDWSVIVKDASASARTFPVHSPVLAHHSEFFRLLFDSSGAGWQENSTREVVVTLPGDDTANAFPFVLDFCYTDAQHSVPIPEREWVRVGVIAEQLQMAALKAQLLEQLEQVFDDESPHKIDVGVLSELFLDTLDPDLAVSDDLASAVLKCMVYYVATQSTGFTEACVANRARLSDKAVVAAMLRVWEVASHIDPECVAEAVGKYVLEHRDSVVSSGRAPEVLEYLDVSVNTVAVWMLALQVGATSVVSRCRLFATRAFYLLDAEGWTTLPREQLSALLCSKSLRVSSEDSVLEVLLLWLANNEATAEEANEMLLRCVDFHFVSRELVLRASSLEVSSRALLQHIVECRMPVEAHQLSAEPVHTQVWRFDESSAYKAKFVAGGDGTAFSGKCFHAFSAECRPCGSARITITPESNTFVGVFPSPAVAKAKSSARLDLESKGVSFRVTSGEIRVFEKLHKKFTSPPKPRVAVDIVVSWNQLSVTFSCGGNVESVDDECLSRGIFITDNYGNAEVLGVLSNRSNESDAEDESEASEAADSDTSD